MECVGVLVFVCVMKAGQARIALKVSYIGQLKMGVIMKCPGQ